MSACFADTFYFLAMLNARDAAHQRVSQYNATSNRPLVTTTWVLTEVADALTRPPDRLLFAPLMITLRQNQRMTIEPPTQELFDRGAELYINRPDQFWSLTDCISFVVMTRHGLTDALTGDHHFEQAGFQALLK